MALTVRLGPKTERALKALASRRQLSRSDVVREAIEQYAARDGAAATGGPFDAWADVLGIVDLGVREPSRTTGEQFAALISRQARARRAR